MSDQQQRFRVVFVGEFNPTQKIDEITEKLKTRFKLPSSIISRLMTGRPVVVKKGVDVETAYRFKRTLEELGCVCRIESKPDNSDVDDKGFIERRKSERRIRTQRRRSVRPGAIQPDRRRHTERRDK